MAANYLKVLVAFILGAILFPIILQWFILYTHEPYVRCDGGGQA